MKWEKGSLGIFFLQPGAREVGIDVPVPARISIGDDLRSVTQIGEGILSGNFRLFESMA